MSKKHGTTAIFTCDNGHPIAVTDVQQSSVGGFTTREMQEHRLKAALANAVAEAYCSETYLRGIDTDKRIYIMNALCSARHGCKITYAYFEFD